MRYVQYSCFRTENLGTVAINTHTHTHTQPWLSTETVSTTSILFPLQPLHVTFVPERYTVSSRIKVRLFVAACVEFAASVALSFATPRPFYAKLRRTRLIWQLSRSKLVQSRKPRSIQQTEPVIIQASSTKLGAYSRSGNSQRPFHVAPSTWLKKRRQPQRLQW